MSISDLFQRVGAPLANVRWSWGGVRKDGAVMLRVWQNETRRINGRTHIQITHHQAFVGKEGDLGYQERLAHIARIKAGAPCFMVMCEPRSAQEIPRSIKKFNERELFRAGDMVEEDGDYWVPLISREPIV
ncbi:MAG: hypothetical protein ACOZB0_06350 [Pseudomonadota bacterium]